MNPTTFRRIREVFEPELDPLGPGHDLSPGVLSTLYALLQVVADDAEVPRDAFEQYVQRRARGELAVLREYEAGARLLDDVAGRNHNKPFADLTLVDRDTVLRNLLRRYPHPITQPRLMRQMRLTFYNFDLMFTRSALRRFRKFVITDFLSYYYSTARGWAVVGYREYPGFVRAETEPCEVKRIETDGERVVLELSDASYDRLRPETLRLDQEGRLTCRTKSGRQFAVFSRAAQQALGDLLEESNGGYVLRIGTQTYKVDLDDATR